MHIAFGRQFWLVALWSCAALGCQSSGSPGGVTYMCGNGLCEGTETDYCAKDCECPAPCTAAVCTAAGDIQDCVTSQAGCKVLAPPKTCGGGKTCVANACIVPNQTIVCGDFKCEPGESSANCPSDCPVVGHVCDSYCGQMGPGGCYCDAGCAKSGDCCTFLGGKPANANSDCVGSTCALCQPSATLRYVTIDGAPESNPDCTSASPGADIDVVALYGSNGSLRGVGKPGTVVHKPGATASCPGGWLGGCAYGKISADCHNDPSDVAGGLITKMYNDSTSDTGYFALGKETVQLQFGACAVSTASIKQCDGKGPLLDILPGDEIDIYEVDGSYKAGSTSSASGIAPASCVCKAEAYEVFVSAKPGTGLQSLGQFSGSKGAIKVK